MFGIYVQFINNIGFSAMKNIERKPVCSYASSYRAALSGWWCFLFRGMYSYYIHYPFFRTGEKEDKGKAGQRSCRDSRNNLAGKSPQQVTQGSPKIYVHMPRMAGGTIILILYDELTLLVTLGIIIWILLVKCIRFCFQNFSFKSSNCFCCCACSSCALCDLYAKHEKRFKTLQLL